MNKQKTCITALLLCLAHATVTQAQALTLTLTPSNYNGNNVSCFGAQDGSIDLTITGGTPPYTIVWSNAATTEDITNLEAGFYSVEVDDADPNTDIVAAEITLTQPLRIQTELTASDYVVNTRHYNISLNGACNGTLSATVTEGTPPYTYTWQPYGQTTANLANLCAGGYALAVTDANGCVQQAQQDMIEPDRDDWTMNGNANTNPTTQFIGTTDNKDVVFKTNNLERLKLKDNGNIEISEYLKLKKFTGDSLPRVLYINPDGTVGKLTVPNVGCTSAAMWFTGNDPNDVLICSPWQRVGVQTTFAKEAFQIGDTWTFHSGGSKVIGYNTYYDAIAGYSKRITNGYASSITFDATGNLFFKIADNSMANDQINFKPGLSIKQNASGNVVAGINTDNPNYTLDVNGDTRFSVKILFTESSGTGGIGYVNDAMRIWSRNHFAIFLDSDKENSSNNNSHTDEGFYILANDNYWSTTVYEMFRINSSGIEYRSAPGNDLNFKVSSSGTIYSRAIQVKPTSFADFVFEPTYNLMSLLELECFIKKNKHLPEIPSEAEMKDNMLDLGEMQTKLLMKIEELTLYVIALEKKYNNLTLKLNIKQD